MTEQSGMSAVDLLRAISDICNAHNDCRPCPLYRKCGNIRGMGENAQDIIDACIEWRDNRKDFKVGDVVKSVYDNTGASAVITKIVDNNDIRVLWADGSFGKWKAKDLEQTGRHLDVENFLEQIGDIFHGSE